MSSMGSDSLENECDKAIEILKLMVETKTGCGPPPEVLEKCVGLAFLRITKTGLFVTGSYGTGLVILRSEDGKPSSAPTAKWSQPSAISTKSVGSGFQAGAQVLETLIVITWVS